MPRNNSGHYLSDKPNPQGYYEIRWTEGGRSKRRTTGETDYRKAQMVFARIVGEMGVVGQDQRIVPTIAEVIDIYVEEKVVDFVGNQLSAISSLMHMREAFGHLRANQLTAGQVKQYVRDRAAGKISWTDRHGKVHGGNKSVPGSVRVELAKLITAFNYAVKTRELDPGDVPYVELPPAAPGRDRWLTREEARRLLDACQPDPAARLTRVYRFAVVGLYTAARRATIETLPWSRIHLQGERSYIDFQDPKRPRTNKRRGVVPVGPELLPILQRAWEERESEWFLDRPGIIQDEFNKAVAAAEGRRIVHRKQTLPDGKVRRFWEVAGTARDPLDGVTPHTLRHTWATWAAQDGVSLFEIAGVLHDTVSTVEKRYAHNCPNHLRGAVGRSLLGDGLIAAE